jgi:hypothetical protein
MAMDNNSNLLDKINYEKGGDKLKLYFHELYISHKEEAINLINDEKLCFSSLFLLRSEIEQFKFFSDLSLRNRISLEVTKDIIEKNVSSIEYLSEEHKINIHTALKWMLQSGANHDGLNHEYDRVLDITAAILIKIYEDKTVLTIVVDIIFKRYEKGYLIHDLVWAFFEAKEPESLALVGKYLLSQKTKEVELATKLLKFALNMEFKDNNEKQFEFFSNWLKENHDFLYFTGETFQQSSNPMPYALMKASKYLCKKTSLHTGNSVKPLTEKENSLLVNFNKIDNNLKSIVADFSFKIYKKDIQLWEKWISNPIEEQIKIAKAGVI